MFGKMVCNKIVIIEVVVMGELNKYCKNCGRVFKNFFGNNVNVNVIIIGMVIIYIFFL